MFNARPITVPRPSDALPGRAEAIPTAATHFVSGRALKGPYPEGFQQAILGLGCFWGAERLFWKLPGVWVTSVGYGGGVTPNPTYKEVCSGRTGHTELVHVVFDPAQVSFGDILKVFFENHDPTQGMRQGNDVGTQYRSAIYTLDAQQAETAIAMRDAYEEALARQGHRRAVTTEIMAAGPYYYAEDYHQQYLAKNPGGYCGIGGTGVSCPMPQRPASLA
jgi:peptide-methionine (S)-S-oxide reductase